MWDYLFMCESVLHISPKIFTRNNIAIIATHLYMISQYDALLIKHVPNANWITILYNNL